MASYRTFALRRPGLPTGTRLALVVATASALTALGVTGAGLLLPSGEPTATIRVLAAVVAIVAAGALIRTAGPSRGATALATVSVAALSVCLVTAPASPITVPWESSPDMVGPSAPTDGDARPRDLLIEPAPSHGAGGGGPLRLPEGADVVIDRGEVVLTLPDGGRITIGGNVELGGVTIERNDGSRVVVGDGKLLEVPPPLDADEPATEPLDALLAVLLGCFAILAFAPPVIRSSERAGVTLIAGTEPPESPQPGPEPPATSVEEGLADVLRSMLADPDPRTSVIGAYARLLTALAEAGFARRDEEAPHEHLWRSLGPLGVRRQPVHQLAELFVRARFTPRPVTDADRQDAISALADAVADLRLQAGDVREAAAGMRVPV